MSDPSNEPDPIKDAWSDVADHFSTFGRTMKERFEREPAPAEPNERGTDPTAALREAFEQLIAAGRDLGDKVAGLVRDDALKGEAREVGASINHALEATVNQITGEMRSFFKGSTPRGDTVETSATDQVDQVPDPPPTKADDA
jgi:hypothetical protein